MNNPNALTWEVFKTTLQINQELDIQFEFAENEWVKPSYHITEIKLAPITSVDCGGKVNQWTEVIVQLWEPEEKQQERAMKSSKALSIINLVEKAIQLDANAEVKIEFGNSKFDTRQMFPTSFKNDGVNLVVQLQNDKVQCKAIGRNETCGTSNVEEACCAPAEKPKIKLKNLASNAACCTPGAGCC